MIEVLASTEVCGFCIVFPSPFLLAAWRIAGRHIQEAVSIGSQLENEVECRKRRSPMSRATRLGSICRLVFGLGRVSNVASGGVHGSVPQCAYQRGMRRLPRQILRLVFDEARRLAALELERLFHVSRRSPYMSSLGLTVRSVAACSLPHDLHTHVTRCNQSFAPHRF